MTAVAKVLIVEDEAVLRASLANGLSKTGGLDVQDAGNVNQALDIIDRDPPDIIVSDIDLPGRTGIELLGELGRRGLSTPVVYVSAYLKAYGAQIPRHANIEVLEKPVALAELRGIIRSKLAGAKKGDEPFSVPDFLQLASMGRRSVVVEVHWPDGKSGSVTVHCGEVWSATYEGMTGVDAFLRVAWRPGGKTHCRTLSADLGPRTLEGTAESLLMDTARRLDEERRSLPSEAPDEQRDSVASRRELLSDEDLSFGDPFPPEPGTDSAIIVEEAFNRQLDRGVNALLARDLATALKAFEAAHGIDPEHPLVNANLKRLQELGYGESEE